MNKYGAMVPPCWTPINYVWCCDYSFSAALTDTNHVHRLLWSSCRRVENLLMINKGYCSCMATCWPGHFRWSPYLGPESSAQLCASAWNLGRSTTDRIRLFGIINVVEHRSLNAKAYSSIDFRGKSSYSGIGVMFSSAHWARLLLSLFKNYVVHIYILIFYLFV